MRKMERFFQAQSVAVVGVSNSPTNMGRFMASNLLGFRYEGSIYLVGPKGGSFLGHKIYPSILEIPEAVDLATILIPAAAVPEALRQCGAKGIRRVILQSAGFRELGEDRRKIEQEILDLLDAYQMRLIGPNCIGIINRHNGLAVPFMPMQVEVPPGRVAVISQSGGVGAMLINTLDGEGLGLAKFASVGNKLNVNEADLLEYLLEDDQTGLIFCYLEGIAEGRRFMELAAASRKPIIVHKSNRGGAGAVIARSHSASLSSDHLVVAAALRQCGIVQVFEQREAAECLKAFSLPEMRGNRLAVISRSGGHAVIAADAADEFGFALPPYPAETIEQVREHSRARVIQLHNPMDLGDLFDLQLYRELAEMTLARDDIDGLIFIHNYQGIFDGEPSRELIANLAQIGSASEKPVAVCVFAPEAELIRNRRAVHFPIFTDPREAVRALARNRDRGKLWILPFASRRPEGLKPDQVRAELGGIQPAPTQLAPLQLARILAAYGIPLVPWEAVHSEEEAVAAAQRFGFPVAAKTGAPHIVHKSDVGGVLLNLADAAAVRQAYRQLTRVGGPAVLVQKMAEPGLEWFIGGRQDSQFGAVVITGLGGIYVEIFRETAMRIAPIGGEEASRLVDECRGTRLLGGVRGQPSWDRDALLEVLVRISWLLHDFPQIRELDLNPVRLFPDGQGCSILDWRATAESG
jgi:acetate---CoA ligase (ADP-forming)